jgi:hypothetical protein
MSQAVLYPIPLSHNLQPSLPSMMPVPACSTTSHRPQHCSAQPFCHTTILRPHCLTLLLSSLLPALSPHVQPYAMAPTCTRAPTSLTHSLSHLSSPTFSHTSVILTPSRLVPACAALRHGPHMHTCTHKPQQRCRRLRSPLGLGEGRQLCVPSSCSRHVAAGVLLCNNLAVSTHMLGGTHTTDQRPRRSGSVVGLAERRKLRVSACTAAARRCPCAFGGMGCGAYVYVCAHAAEQRAGYEGATVGMAEQPELCLQGLER